LTGNGPIPAPGRWRVAFVAARRRFIEKEAIKAGALNLSPSPSLGLSRNRRNNHTKDKAQDCKALHRVLHFGMRMRASEVVDQIGERFPSTKNQGTEDEGNMIARRCSHSLDFAAIGRLAEFERELILSLTSEGTSAGIGKRRWLRRRWRPIGAVRNALVPRGLL
jgi:hypothetical protein